METPISARIVDDDIYVRSMFETMLDDADFNLKFAENGTEAAAAAQSSDFDVIMLDILMPGRDGIETLLELRKSGCTAHIIAMSTGGRFDPDTMLNSAHALGADAMLRKSFTRDELLQQSTPPLPPEPELTCLP